jgi:hypothetical protein
VQDVSPLQLMSEGDINLPAGSGPTEPLFDQLLSNAPRAPAAADEATALLPTPCEQSITYTQDRDVELPAKRSADIVRELDSRLSITYQLTACLGWCQHCHTCMTASRRLIAPSSPSGGPNMGSCCLSVAALLSAPETMAQTDSTASAVPGFPLAAVISACFNSNPIEAGPARVL